MTYIPIMAQYVEPGMEGPMGVVQDIEDDGVLIHINFELCCVAYGLERPVLIAIDLEAAS